MESNEHLQNINQMLFVLLVLIYQMIVAGAFVRKIWKVFGLSGPAGSESKSRTGWKYQTWPTWTTSDQFFIRFQGRECGSMKKRRTRICRVPPCYGDSKEEKAAARPPIPSDNNCVVQFGASYRFNNDVKHEFEHRSVQLYTGFEGGQQYLLVSRCFNDDVSDDNELQRTKNFFSV